MPNKVKSFKEVDLRRAIKGAKSSGMNHVVVTISPRSGEITIMEDRRTTEADQSVEQLATVGA